MDNNTKRGSNYIWGIVLIAMGAIFLLNQIFPAIFGALIWSVAFALGGVMIYGAYTRNKNNWWLQIPAYVMVVIAALIQLGAIRWLPGEFIGAFVMAAIGFPFLYVYFKNTNHWWALIPAYAMFAIGGLILLTWLLPSGQIELLIPSYVFFAIAAPFLYVYLRNRSNWWALIPGGIMAAMGIAFLTAGLAYFIPALMILGGLYLLVRHFSGSSERSAPEPTSERPISGPEADRPDFEPLRTGSPEADR